MRSKPVLLQFLMILGKHSILTMTNVQVFGAFCWSLRCLVFASRYNTICLFLPPYPITLFTFRQAHMEQIFLQCLMQTNTFYWFLLRVNVCTRLIAFSETKVVLCMYESMNYYSNYGIILYS